MLGVQRIIRKVDFHRRLSKGEFEEEVNRQMQLRTQRGRELRKTPDLAKEDNYYLEAAE